MLFRIAEENKQRAAHAFTVEKIPHDYGYKKSAMLYPKSNRIMHYYEIDMIDTDRIVCTVRHKNTDCIVALVWLSGYTPESIEVDQAELYRNCSNYPYRREYNEKYLKKYDQIACIVHGAIAAGLLFDTAETPTEPETSEAGQDTACTDKEPQEGAEMAQKTTDMETFKKAYSAAYSHLYDHADTPAVKAKIRIYSALFDEQWEQIKDTAKAFCQITSDLITSDREAAAFMIALEAVGTPTDGKTATDGETTTTTETEPQRATEAPRKTIQTGERLYSHPHRHMVIVEGLQGDLVKVIYKGRLYLVCCNDLYTDESETTPAMLPQQAAESAEKTADDTITAASDTDHTEASQAPQKIVSDNAGEAANSMTAQDAQKAPQSEGTTAGGQTITAEGNEAQRASQSRKEDEAGKSITPPHNEPPRASQSPTEAASNAEPGRVSQSPAEATQGQERTAGGQRTTGTDTRPPQAAERANAANYMTTGTTTPHRTRGAPRKVTFSGQMRKMDQIPVKFWGTPFLIRFFRKVDPVFSGVYMGCMTGGDFKTNTVMGAVFDQKIFQSGGKQNGEIRNARN